MLVCFEASLVPGRGLVVLQLVGDVFTAEAREREVAPGGSCGVAPARHALHQPAQP